MRQLWVYLAAPTAGDLARYFHLDDDDNNIVVHPASIEISSRYRVKTDKRDALKIANQLSAQRLREIHVPELAQEGKSLFFTQGLIEEDDKTRVSENWLMDKLLEIEEKCYPNDFLYSVNMYKEEWNYLTEKNKRN